MMDVLKFKRGDTLALDGVRTDINGDPFPLTGVSIACEMVRGDLVVPITSAVSDPALGTFTLGLTASETASLDAGVWQCDIEFTDGTSVSSTQTFLMMAIGDVTNAS